MKFNPRDLENGWDEFKCLYRFFLEGGMITRTNKFIPEEHSFTAVFNHGIAYVYRCSELNESQVVLELEKKFGQKEVIYL